MTSLSIITVNLNNAEGLRRTIESVLSQTVKPFEFIIIDGGSTDGSIDAIRRYEKGISFWLSEKDGGIYDAMNKGIMRSHGDYLLFLNSGDIFASEGVLGFFASLAPSSDMVYGKTVVSVNGKQYLYGKTPRMLTAKAFDSMFTIHQSVFFRRHTFETLGLYSLENSLVSDYEHILKIIFSNGSVQYVNRAIASYAADGVSSSNPKLRHIEVRRVRRKYYPPLQWLFLSLYYETPRIMVRMKKKLFKHIFGKERLCKPGM